VRLVSLDGWRGLTALLVIAYHLEVEHSLYHVAWLRNGAPILEFFFVVSGFVMALGFRDRVRTTTDFWAYIVRRFGRVWPLHLATLAMLVLLQVLRFFVGASDSVDSAAGLRWDALPQQIFLLQTWTADTAMTWNWPAWTLSIEVFAYALLGVVILLSPTRAYFWTLVLLIIAGAGVVFMDDMAAAPTYNVVTISRGLTGFFCGVMLYELWRLFPVRTRRTASILEVLGTAAFIGGLAVRFEGPAYFLYHAGFALLIYGYASDLGVFSKWLSFKPLVWLGKVAFSMYMLHAVVVIWIRHLVDLIQPYFAAPLREFKQTAWQEEVLVFRFPEQRMNDVFALLYVGGVVLGAAILYHFVENPTRIYFTKMGAKVAQGAPASGRDQLA